MPGSSATVTLWTSDSNGLNTSDAARWKRIIVGIYTSHASAASGLQFDVSVNGTDWRNLVSYSVSATTLTVNYVATAAPYLRARYVNSASTITTWEMWVIGDNSERGTQ